MILEGFENKIIFAAFKKANKNIDIKETDKIFVAFKRFISNEKLLNSALQDNEKGISPIISFLNYKSDLVTEYYLENKDDIRETRKLRKKIILLWDYLFLNVNRQLFRGKRMVKSEILGLFHHLPVYQKDVSQKMRVFIESTLFATRTVACRKIYENVLEDIVPFSIPITGDKINPYSILIDYFISHLFKGDDVSLEKEVVVYNGTNLDTCKKKSSSLFMIQTRSSSDDANQNNIKDTSVIDMFDKTVLEEELKQNIKSFINEAKNIKTSYKKIDVVLDDFQDIDSCLDNCSGESLIDYADRLNSEFKSIRFKLTNYYSKTEYIDQDFEELDLLGKIISRVNDTADILEIISDDRYRLLLYINRFGTISIILFDYLSFISKWNNEGYDSEKDNKLVEEAFKCSLKIENRNHKLSKLFNLINLNKVIKTAKDDYQCICGLPFDIKNNEETKKIKTVSQQIYENATTSKAVFIRLTFNHKDIISFDESAMIYFDLLSLLVGYSHSYDKYTLWEYTKHEKVIFKEYKRKIKDAANSRTSHIYFDDSQFTYSIMDQSPRFEKFNVLTNKTPDYRNLQSHKHRLYSLWEFSSICNSLIFASTSMLVHSLLLKQTKKESQRVAKVLILSSQHRLARIYWEIKLNLNHLVYNPKGRNFPLIDTVFHNAGLIETEEKTKEIFDSSWQFANLNNGRLYQRFGFYVTISSFFVTLVAFAWAGAVFIDCKVQCRQGYDMWNLFRDLFKTPKFFFVVIVALIPLVTLLILMFHDYFKNKRIRRNIVNYFIEKDLKTETKKFINVK